MTRDRALATLSSHGALAYKWEDELRVELGVWRFKEYRPAHGVQGIQRLAQRLARGGVRVTTWALPMEYGTVRAVLRLRWPN